MKKRQKKILGFLLACMMVCLPVTQAMAAVSVDASAGVSGQVLFPGDTLINAGVPIMKDGEQVGLDTPGSWTNTDDGRVYTASTSEDGASITLTAAGCVLVVENGTASMNDGSDDSENHYIYQAGEEPSIPQDMAYYPAGVTVEIKADAPSDGMAFAEWTTTSEEVSFADPSSAVTTITMPDYGITVTATYQPETSAPEATEPAQEPGVEEEVIPAGSDTEDGVIPTAPDGAGDVSSADPDGEIGDISNDSYSEDGVISIVPDDAGNEMASDGSNAGSEKVSNGSNEGNEAASDGSNAGNEAASDGSNAGNETASDGSNAGNETALDGSNAGDGTISIDLSTGDETASTNPTSDTPGEYTVTVYNGTGGGPFTAGTWVTVTADDIEGKVFNGWYVDSLNATLDDLGSPTASFQMPEANVVLSAQYVDDVNAQTEEPALFTEPRNDEEQIDESESNAAETDATPAETNAAETEAAPTEAAETEAAETNAAETEADPTEVAETETAETEAPQTDENTYEVVVENGAGSGVYEAGSTVTIEAQEKDGEVFQKWEASSSEVQIADPTEKITTFTMPEEGVVVTAEYAAAPYSVSVENGVLVEEDGQTGTSGTYTEEQSVKIEANEASEGEEFKNWTVQIDGTETDAASVLEDATAPETVLSTVQGNTVITANYGEASPQTTTYTVTVANGTLSSDGAVQDPTDTSKWTVTENTQVVITANPNPAGQAFTGWKITDDQGVEVDPSGLGIADATSSSLTLSAVTQNLNFQAQYEGIQYAVTVNDGAANYTAAVSGTVVTITADEAPEGMEFDYWQVETGNTSLTDAFSETTSFTMPMADVTVSAFYKLKEYELTVVNGTGSQQYFHMGDAVTVSSNYPASGKEFNAWVATSGNVSFADSSRWKTTFAMPASDVTVKATYKDGPSTDDNRILDIISGGEYYTGATIKFTASGAGMGNTNPNPGDYRYRPSGYQIGNVTGSWNASPYTTSMAIRAAGEYTLKVTYAKDVFDGSNWVADGTTDTKSVTFRVIAEAAGVATGDETPIAMVVAIAAVSCILFIILLIVVIRRRKKK